MRFILVASLASFAAVASAHFELQYPSPRGPFVDAAEVNFCDGYTNVGSSRTIFPLNNGVINLNSEHPTWTAGVIVSTKQNPMSFSDFNSSSGYQLVVPYFQTNGEGMYCFPINLLASGVSGVQDGANVTIQIIYDGGDGILYQCSDLTLSTSATVPSNATSTCMNVTASAAASSPTATASSGAIGTNVVSMYGVVVVVVAVLTGLGLVL